jgi:hypothetical protein
MFNFLYTIHSKLLADQKITPEFVTSIQSKTLFDTTPDVPIYKTLYKNCFCAIANLFFYIRVNKKEMIKDYEYVQSIIKLNNVDEIERNLKYNRDFKKYTSVLHSHPIIKEMEEKTSNMFDMDKENNIVSAMTKYTAGNCWFNIKLSHGLPLEDCENEMLKSINLGAQFVKPLSMPVALFHGFEKYTKYDIVENSLNIPGIVSKTISLNIARRFATAVNYFRPEFLIIHYEAGSKHMHQSIRPFDEEFEFISHSNETFKVIRTCKYFEGCKLMTFYVCVPQKKVENENE